MLILAVFCCLYVSHFQKFSYFKAQSSRRDNQKESQHVLNWTSLYCRGQDWFALSNFLGLGSTGVYVDVGASLPFDYSNTATGQQLQCTQMPLIKLFTEVMLDRCLGWQGVCVEPNPHLSILLEAGASCRGHPLNFLLLAARCIGPVKSLRCWTEV